MDRENAIFDRLSLLVGDETMDVIKSKRVIVFGVGGVGSWCAESLIRSGICHLTIVDSDYVSVTNVNRQSQATIKTIGMVKVVALKERLLDINPQADINAVQDVYSAENSDSFRLSEYDYIIDAIDSLRHKAQLILHATRCQGKLFSAMGAALKIDPTKVSVAEFWDVIGCPLARALRKKYNKLDSRPEKKFLCVYSPELLVNKGQSQSCETNHDDGLRAETTSQLNSTKSQINGTTSHVTAIFGFTLAGLVMRDIYDSAK